MIELADSEARYISILRRRTLRMLERELAPLGLGPGRYLYLFALYFEDGRSQQALADAVSADKAAATRALARLEADGYVRRAACNCDRRVTRVYLTPTGLELQPVLESAAIRVNDALVSPLGQAERAHLRDMLRSMTLAGSDA
jgi:DNA-binding MarR family transcriptional regulator